MSLALGYPHPDYLLPYLSAHQFNDWKIYYQLEPWGVLEEDLQHSKTREIIFAASGAKSKGKPFTWKDFSVLNNIREDKPKQSVDDMKKFLLGVASSQNKLNSKNKKTPPKRRK